jgi:metal-responsive CopG/Arc/MetJ family transcriptional regulator
MPKVKFTVSISDKVVERVEDHMKKNNRNRSNAVETLLVIALERTSKKVKK